MAIAFRSGANTVWGTRTNTTATAPAGIVNGDILVALMATGAASPPVPSTPAGWTAFGTDKVSTSGSGFEVRLRLYWKRAASESGNYTFTHASCSSAAWIGCFSGALASGTPLGAASTNGAGSGSTSTGTGITTTAANSWLLWFSHDWGDTTNNLTPPTGMTERLDAAVIYTATQLIAAAGATGNRTMTNNSTGPQSAWSVRMVELLAVAGTESYAREIETGVDWRETEAGFIRRTEGDYFVYDQSIVEAAAAAEMLTSALAYTRALAETASAAETITGLLTRIGAVTETASAAETIGTALLRTGTVTETAAAADTVGGATVKAGAIAETATAAETAAGLLIGSKAIAESASAAETITYNLTGASGTTYNLAQAEAVAAADTVTGRLTALGAIAESASGTADTVTASVVPAGGVIAVSIAETAAAAETIGATVIPAAQIIDVTVAESASAADTLTADIRRWTKEPPPWANWTEEATAAAGWTKTVPAFASWIREDAEAGDWLLATRPINQWTKE